MKRNDLQELQGAVAAVRAKRKPDLSAEFLRQVVLIEERNPESEERALKELRALVEKVVSESEGT